MRIACVQSDVEFGKPEGNVRRCVAELEKLKGREVDLAVFPEAFLTGYCVDCAEDASAVAIPRDHPGLAAVQEACDRLGMIAVVGFAESFAGGLANSAVIFEPGVVPRFYRKTHLPHLGLDRFVQPGQELPVFDTKLGRIGILICFDLRYPEAARALALKGAEVIFLPTNWPVGAEVSAEHISIARAAENRVFLATCNRTGEENGFRFIGMSKIVAPSGKVLAAAGSGPEVIVADVDLAEARVKRNVTIPGKYETDVFGCLRPELYRS